MSGTVQLVSSSSQFEEHLATAKSKGTGVFVDFYAEWCGPCKMVAPKLVELAKEFPQVIFLKVDVDQCQELSQTYKVRAMPTFLGFKDGKVVGEVVGANLDKMRELIQQLLPVAFSGSSNKLGGSGTAKPVGDNTMDAAQAAREARARAAEARFGKA